MNAVGGAVQKVTRAVGRAATMTTETAGAIGGAAIDGAVGGVTGAAAGLRRGLRKGSRSTPAAALTIGAIGAAGLVEWPVLIAVGGTALVAQQIHKRRTNGQPEATAAAADEPAKSTQPGTTPTKAAKSTGTRRSPAKKSTSARRTRGTPSRGRQ